jgi:hypothetical protein
MSAKIDLTGKRFGRLIVESIAPKDRHGNICWKVKCDCGNTKSVNSSVLLKGTTRSCGCLNQELRSARLLSHGMTNTPTYRSWQAMKSRCSNPNDESYARYGGRRISVCDRWLGENGFKNFYKDMGVRPKELTLERINNDGNYEPSNCKWATRKEQNRNTRTNRILEYGGRRQSLSAWAEEYGLNASLLSERLRNRWTIKKALNTPVGPQGVKKLR